MSTSVIVVIDENADKEKIRNYWNPVKLKYADRPEVAEFIITNNVNDGIQKARFNSVFITPWNVVPTYQTLIAIEHLKENQCLLPGVHNSAKEVAGAFSVNKKTYNGESSAEWIAREDITVIDTTTMYKV